MPPGLETRLRTGAPLVADGGMGVLLQAAVPGLRCPEEANLRAPESVVSLHLGFIRAGADVIETNSFGANRHKLRAHFLEHELGAINDAAVKLAREAREISGRDVYIAGSIGPIGDIGEREDDREALFAEQAELLEGRGVDLIVLETFYDLDELVTAVEAVRSVVSRPVVGADELRLRRRDAGRRPRGRRGRAGAWSPARGVRREPRRRAAGGACVRWSRCPARARALAALPNLGLASIVGGRIVYPHATPEYFADFAAHAERLGARLIGGCCGTTPAEIAAIRAAVDRRHEPSTVIAPRPRERAAGGRTAGVRDEAAADARGSASSWSRSSSTRRAGATQRRCSPWRASSPRRAPSTSST